MPLTISGSQPTTPDITNLTHEYQGLGPFDKSYKSMSDIIDGKILKDQTINLIPIDSNRERIPVPIPSLESHKKSKPKLIPLSGKEKKKDAHLPDENRTLELRTRQVRFKNI